MQNTLNRSRVSNNSAINKSKASIKTGRASYVAQKTTEFDMSKKSQNLLNFESKLDKDL